MPLLPQLFQQLVECLWDENIKTLRLTGCIWIIKYSVLRTKSEASSLFFFFFKYPSLPLLPFMHFNEFYLLLYSHMDLYTHHYCKHIHQYRHTFVDFVKQIPNLHLWVYFQCIQVGKVRTGIQDSDLYSVLLNHKDLRSTETIRVVFILWAIKGFC